MSFRPSAIVLECGADSIKGDNLGTFNISIKQHGEILKHILGLNCPTLVLGGGGYVPDNVARCWAYETGLTINMELDEKLPE